jgi:hypothetical protein
MANAAGQALSQSGAFPEKVSAGRQDHGFTLEPATSRFFMLQVDVLLRSALS